jgi:tRNA threonylcarbamoyladenosine biosynthesis protein TsaE
MVTHISHSPAETQALGEALGRTVQSGCVVGLCGDLGAGKTQFVKGMARGLGIAARVQSPTFALVNVYTDGRLPLFHLDLYRLETPEAIAGAGLEEYLRPEGITVIEWAERLEEIRNPKSEIRRKSEIRNPNVSERGCSPASGIHLRVRIETVSETERRITYEDIGY